VRLWIDARAAQAEQVDAWRTAIGEEADVLAGRTGVAIELTTASRSAGVAFDPGVRAALRRATGGDELVCFAGHDAGVLAARVPAGMVFVRSPTGISHAPEEDVALEDAAAAANALLAALQELLA
jgi:N-carbamoyl-L-amino-acid hydrolase